MSHVQVHASCVAFGSKAVLIQGKSGSGKSDLVLRLLDSPGYGIGQRLHQALLVADDQVILERIADQIVARAPLSLAGKLEIRGQGIVELPWVESAMLCLVVDLMPVRDIPRLPEPSELTVELLGMAFPRLVLDPAQVSATSRIRSFLT